MNSLKSSVSKSTDLPRLINAESIDWSEIVFMIERKISGSELSRYAQVTTQAVGAWRRGIQGPCLYTGISLIFLVAELYMEEAIEDFDSPADYFGKIGEILPRKGHVPWYPTNNHRKFTPTFRKPPKRLEHTHSSTHPKPHPNDQQTAGSEERTGTQLDFFA